MIVLLPFTVSVLAAIIASSTPQQAPTNDDLARALSASAGESFGAVVEKPYEVFLRMDPKVVPDDLLLAILIAGATKGDPVVVAKRMMSQMGHDISQVRQSQVYRDVDGIGDAAKARVSAALELARRLDYRDVFSKKEPITSPALAVAAFRTMSFGQDEILSVLFLDRRRRLVSARVLTIGSDGFTVVDPRQIFRYAMDCGAAALILCHNHPSGEPSPSSQDRDVTERVARAGRVMGIPLLDHIVLGAEGRYTSFAEQGELPPWTAPGPTWTAEP